MEYVAASFDPRNNTYECHSVFSFYGGSHLNYVEYKGTKFYVMCYGETFAEAEKNALDKLLRHFAERSMYHADKGTRFADYCNFICDVQRKKVPAE